MNKGRRLFSLALITSAVFCAMAADNQLVLYNGKIFTGNENQLWAEAISIRGERIHRVGSNRFVLRNTHRSVEKINLGGRLVVPGFNDAHLHVFPQTDAFTLPFPPIPGPGASLDELKDQIADAASQLEPGRLILGVMGELAFFDPQADRFQLDLAAPEHPVLLFTWSSHGGLVNTLAMEQFNISEDEPDPFGGFYGRTEDGVTVNGILFEYALFEVLAQIASTIPLEARRQQYLTQAEMMAALGYTSAQEIPIGIDAARSRAIFHRLRPKIRYRVMCAALRPEDPCFNRSRNRSSRVTLGGRKWLTDGTPIERTMALNNEYADDPGNFGVLNVPALSLDQILTRAIRGPRRANQPILHAVGDRAVDHLLDSFDRIAPMARVRVRRPRIEHGDLIFPRHFERIRQLGIVVVQNPVHLGIPELDTRLDAATRAMAQPFASLLQAGIPFAIGSDLPNPNPYLDLFLAVTHPTRPEEALTMEQAVMAYTKGSAYAEFQEHHKGMLKRGYLADLAVLSQDIFAIPPSPDLLTTTSLLTLVGGERVHDSGSLPADPD